MESLGAKLKETRESLGYSIEKVGRETNISRSYLAALEEEDFSVFPGETYLLGFLRNYAEYLGLEGDRIVALYRNIQIQEQPAPIEELIKTKPEREGRRKLLPVAIILVILLLGGAVFFLLKGGFLSLGNGAGDEPAAAADSLAPEAPAALFDEEILEQPFSVGDGIDAVFGGEKERIVLKAIAGEQLELDVAGEVLLLGAGESRVLDLDNDGSGDMTLLLRSLDADTDSVVLQMDRSVNGPGAPSRREPDQIPDAMVAGDADVPAEMRVPQSGQAGSPGRQEPSQTIFESDYPEPYVLNVVFRGYCLVRYLSDNSVREERYFHKGETFRLDVSREVCLWVSNAGSFSAKIGGRELVLGEPGEVVVKVIRWEKNRETGKYGLTMQPLY